MWRLAGWAVEGTGCKKEWRLLPTPCLCPFHTRLYLSAVLWRIFVGPEISPPNNMWNSAQAGNLGLIELVPVMAFLPPAPEKLLYLICGGCNKGCECKKNGPACSTMCRCSGEVYRNSTSPSIYYNYE
uniref:Uncharacterized protein n=1 Tax=Timema bartmani TaxID=61472 RepID=A0A7R9F921_9NEOP|nr:unnamed protein product [Timema bartmani]